MAVPPTPGEGMGKDESKRSFLQGFGEGLRQAWIEIGRLASRGLTSQELAIMAKSKVAVLYHEVEAMGARIDRDGGFPGEAASPRVRIEHRGTYLVRESKPEAVFEYLRGLVGSGARGLCISRIHPDDVARRHALGDIEYVWLSRSEGKPSDVTRAEPTELVKLASAIVKFLEVGSDAAVALEGLEYLASLNGFPSVLRFVQTLNEKVLVNESRLLVTVNPEAMKAQEYTLLATETAGEIEA